MAWVCRSSRTCNWQRLCMWLHCRSNVLQTEAQVDKFCTHQILFGLLFSSLWHFAAQNISEHVALKLERHSGLKQIITQKTKAVLRPDQVCWFSTVYHHIHVILQNHILPMQSQSIALTVLPPELYSLASAFSRRGQQILYCLLLCCMKGPCVFLACSGHDSCHVRYMLHFVATCRFQVAVGSWLRPWLVALLLQEIEGHWKQLTMAVWCNLFVTCPVAYPFPNLRHKESPAGFWQSARSQWLDPLEVLLLRGPARWWSSRSAWSPEENVWRTLCSK